MNIEKENLPECVGFIMDGNRRWAKNRGLSTAEGHAEGFDVMKKIIDSVYDNCISHMVCYAFSTENWNRPEEEVGCLMSLFREGLKDIAVELKSDDRNINFRIIGEISKLPEDLQKEIKALEDSNSEEPNLTVWVAISYGARAEILQAVNRAVSNKDKVTEESFEKYLWTKGMPDPDIVIRTGGERRLSNFLLWQIAYSEFFFTDTLWPDFGEKEFQSMLIEYAGRQRRKGK